MMNQLSKIYPSDFQQIFGKLITTEAYSEFIQSSKKENITVYEARYLRDTTSDVGTPAEIYKKIKVYCDGTTERLGLLYAKSGFKYLEAGVNASLKYLRMTARSNAEKSLMREQAQKQAVIDQQRQAIESASKQALREERAKLREAEEKAREEQRMAE